MDVWPSSPALSAVLAGVTRCGKTTWALRLLNALDVLWPGTRVRSVLLVSPFRNARLEAQLRLLFGSVHVAQRLEPRHATREFLGSPSDGLGIVLIDDLGARLKQSAPLEELFIHGVSHLNLMVLLTVHNVYEQHDASFRTAIRNAQYIVAFYDGRAGDSLARLSAQIFGSRLRGLIPACLEEQQRAGRRGAHVIIDTRVDCHPRRRIFAHTVPPADGEPCMYETRV